MVHGSVRLKESSHEAQRGSVAISSAGTSDHFQFLNRTLVDVMDRAFERAQAKYSHHFVGVQPLVFTPRTKSRNPASQAMCAIPSAACIDPGPSLPA